MWLRSSESSSRARSRAAERILLSEQRKPGEVRNDAGRVRAARAERSRGAAAAPRSRRRRPPGEGGARGGVARVAPSRVGDTSSCPFSATRQVGGHDSDSQEAAWKQQAFFFFFFFRTNTETDYFTKALN